MGSPGNAAGTGPVAAQGSPLEPQAILGTWDWLVVLAYVAFALAIGVRFARRAGKDVDQYFLSGRSLPWWIAGTSMVATSFAADTPLLIAGWVRDEGIWKNWLWWSFAASGMLQTFLFARWWRRGGVMTKAELAELRYGGRAARPLRFVLGVLHAGFTNTITMCWVLIAAGKISVVLFQIDQRLGLAVACAVALAYSLLSGFWGVVMTDLAQFAIAMAGAIVLAAMAWSGIGGTAGLEAALADGLLGADHLAFFPAPGAASPFEPAFWTVPVTALAVYLGLQWWAVESVDGAIVAVQRIAASRDEREGLLATLWFNVAHYALRPWPWILVGLASLVVLPTRTVEAPADGRVLEVSGTRVLLDTGAAEPVALALAAPGASDWVARPRRGLGPDDEVRAGEELARTDSEEAYVVMLARFLPVGLLGLVAASLLAAFMSTMDTHMNLAASFFVNDVYRPFLARGRSDHHYVTVARVVCTVSLLLSGAFALVTDSISDLFVLFLAFLGGVGPVYVLRWLWWRVKASTEITAMVASAVTTCLLTWGLGTGWPETPLTPGGVLSGEGRIVLVALVSLGAALVAVLRAPRPDPADLVPFYARVRPFGAWGPVRELAGVDPPRGEVAAALVGTLGGLAAVFGLLVGLGQGLLGRPGPAALACLVAVAGTLAVLFALRRLAPRGSGGGSAGKEP